MSAPEELPTSAQLREANNAIEQLQHNLDDADEKYLEACIELEMAQKERDRLKQQVDPLASRAEQLARDLAASQADLTRAEQERTEAMAMLGSVVHERNNAQSLAATRLQRIGVAREGLDRLTAERDRLRAERDGVREELARQVSTNEDLEATLAMRTGQLRAARDQVQALDAELVSARTELVQLRDLTDHLREQLNQLRSWQVFRGGEELVCVPCGGPIERGQAVEPVPGGDPHGSTRGSFAHVHCPTPDARRPE